MGQHLGNGLLPVWHNANYQNQCWLSTGSTVINSLGPSDAIWCWRSWSTLVQVMACCLTAPSHYLNQCWLIISMVLWHSSEDIIIRRFEDTNQQSKTEDYIFKITLRSPRGQWVNIQNNYFKKINWQCCLQSIRHFVQTSIYQVTEAWMMRPPCISNFQI